MVNCYFGVVNNCIVIALVSYEFEWDPKQKSILDESFENLFMDFNVFLITLYLCSKNSIITKLEYTLHVSDRNIGRHLGNRAYKSWDEWQFGRKSNYRICLNKFMWQGGRE